MTADVTHVRDVLAHAVVDVAAMQHAEDEVYRWHGRSCADEAILQVELPHVAEGGLV